MAWDWAIDTFKGLIAIVVAWFANYLRKESKPILRAIKKLANIVKILERMESLQAIHDSKFKGYIHVSRHPIYEIDTIGAITYVNQAWVDLTGFKDDKDAYGFGYMRAVHPEDRDEIEKQRQMIEKHNSSFNGIVRFKNLKTDQIIICDCVSQPFTDDKGKIIGTIGILYPYP